MVVIIKHYFVDSENVNDNWLILLDLADDDDEIIVFYTKKSPHMSYASVIRLLQANRPVRFEECHEGSNALDFQLISYLGYRMNNDTSADSEYIIMSNDTGFDSAVQFWKERNFPVKRFNVNYCKSLFNKQKNAAALANEDLPFSDALDLAKEQDSQPIPAEPAQEILKEIPNEIPDEIPNEISKDEKAYPFQKKEVDIFINCLGRENLVAIHETLVHVYGQKQGQTIYKTVKDKAYPLTEESFTRTKKVKLFSDIIFSHSEIVNPGNFVEFLEKNRDKAKNLNGMRAAIVKSYGNGNGMKYYSLFKPYFKMISALK